MLATHVGAIFGVVAAFVRTDVGPPSWSTTSLSMAPSGAPSQRPYHRQEIPPFPPQSHCTAHPTECHLAPIPGLDVAVIGKQPLHVPHYGNGSPWHVSAAPRLPFCPSLKAMLPPSWTSVIGAALLAKANGRVATLVCVLPNQAPGLGGSLPRELYFFGPTDPQ